MTIVPNVLDLKKLQQEIINIVDKFPTQKRKEILFDQWSLKDVLTHLCGWDELTVNAINNLKNGQLSVWGKSVDEMNRSSTGLRKDKSWDDIYNEFVDNSQKLVDIYNNLPDDLWEKPLYSDKKFSPTKFIKIDIDHYQEHLEIIKEKL